MQDVNGFSVTQLVIRNSSLSGSAWAVSVAIADRYDQRKGYSAVSSRYIASKTGLSTKTVTAALNDIEDSGEWATDKAHGSTTKYRPNLEKLSLPQEKKTSESGRGRASSNPIIKKTPTKKKELKPSVEIPKELDEDGYPLIDEETDPLLDGLPLLSNDEDEPEVVNPPVLSTPLAMAIRIHKRTDIKTRVKPEDFTVEKLTALIESLYDNGNGYPLEAIDILLWIQCESRQPLNIKFFNVVLAKCIHNGEIVSPQKWDETKRDPAHDVAMKVYEIYSARHPVRETEYAASL